jgi:N-methylhydantoinase A/oxoprolinase/acetone carboxylase beta subunit
VTAGADGAATAAAFHRAHAARFGHADRHRPVEIVNVRVVASGIAARVRLRHRPAEVARPRGGRVRLDDLPVGTRLTGPLVLDGTDATGRIARGWRGVVHPTGAVLLERGR